jgi:sigma-B regulation protein RsbU (phosphoserine phosphatase)
VDPVKFGVLYRPAGWVSGDIYDVVRLDETNVGFYVADVVGHGMPAALLTMFIKKALQTKRIVGHTYEIVPPHVSLQELNIDICEQNLPSCQFCTAVYCVVDVAELTLTYARGGHPEPIVMHSTGEIERLWVEGSLLGIFAGENYRSARYQLRAGDRLLLYTDGAEDELRRQPTGEMLPIEKSLARWASLTREEMLLQLTAGIDSSLERTPPKDDITVLVMDVGG